MTNDNQKMRVGRYTIEVLEFENRPTEIWIAKESGEGGTFSYTAFEDAIDGFFEENF